MMKLIDKVDKLDKVEYLIGNILVQNFQSMEYGLREGKVGAFLYLSVV